MTSTCPWSSVVDAHFKTKTSFTQEHELREHLLTCPTCKHRYQRYLLLERIDPGQPRAKERLEAGLGLAPRRLPMAPLAVAALVVALGGLVFRFAGDRTSEAGYSARGSSLSASVFAFRLRDGQTEPLANTARVGDELAFSYVNPGGAKRLMIFAVDSAGQVFWFHPAWVDVHDNPVAVPIRTSTKPVELNEAVRQPFAQGPLTIRALFTDDALTVKQVEEALTNAKLEALNAAVQIISIDVRP